MSLQFTEVEKRLQNFINLVDRYAIFYLLILLIINTLIKVWYAGDMPYWLDETSSVFIAQKTVGTIIRESLIYPNPPLYFILLKGWITLFGISEFSTRALSVFFSVLTIFPLYYLARRFINLETAIYVTLIFTLSQIHLFFAHETRGYTLISFMTVLSFYFYWLTVTAPRIRNLVYYILTITLLLYIHPVPIIIIGIQFLCLAFFFREYRKGVYSVIIGQLITGGLFSIWILNNAWFSGMNSWITSPDFETLKGLMIKYSNSGLLLWLYVLLLILFILFIVIRYFQKKPLKSEARPFYISLLWGLLPILAIFIISQFSSRFIPRYMLFATPGIYLLISFIIAASPVNRMVKFSLVLVILIISGFNMNLNPEKGEDWPTAVAFMEKYRDDSTAVIISADYQVMTFAYYYDKDIFRMGDEARFKLEEESIFITKGSEIFDRFDLAPFNKIILFQSHETAADPELTLRNYLTGHYTMTDWLTWLRNVSVYLFDMNLKTDTLFFNFENEDGFNSTGDESDIAHSGRHVSNITKDNIYSKGLTCAVSDISDLYSSYIVIRVWSYTESDSSAAGLVCSLENKDSVYFWQADKINPANQSGSWQETFWRVKPPPSPNPEDIFKIYVYNTGKDDVLIDDLEVVFYK